MCGLKDKFNSDAIILLKKHLFSRDSFLLLTKRIKGPFKRLAVACKMHQGVGNRSKLPCIQDDRANVPLSPL